MYGLFYFGTTSMALGSVRSRNFSELTSIALLLRCPMTQASFKEVLSSPRLPGCPGWDLQPTFHHVCGVTLLTEQFGLMNPDQTHRVLKQPGFTIDDSCLGCNIARVVVYETRAWKGVSPIRWLYVLIWLK